MAAAVAETCDSMRLNRRCTTQAPPRLEDADQQQRPGQSLREQGAQRGADSMSRPTSSE